MSAPFNIDLALTLATVSQWAYGKTPIPAGVDAAMIDMLPGRDVQALVVRDPRKLVVAFRGTDDNRGWLIDASIAFKGYGARELGVKMHTGFLEDVDAIAGKLVPILMKAHTDGLKIFGTGHSKGAGEILPFAYILAKEAGIKMAEVITFGGPRVFNRAGSRDYETLLIPTWRVLDEEDIVARIPWRFGLYRHVGQTAFFDAYGQMAQNEPWFSHIESDIIGIIREAFRRKNALFADHPCQMYIDRLTAWKQQIEG